MTEKELKDLLKKYSEGQTTAEESNRVNMFLERLMANKDSIENIAVDEGIKSQIFKEIKREIANERGQEPTSPKMRQRFLKGMLKVAAIVSLLALGIAYYQSTLKPEAESTITYSTKSTTKGQKKTVVLKDGTQVKLNAGSSLAYPDVFGNDRREVELQGEAYFDVAEDHNRPFIVITGKIATTALGTSFNIEAYPTSDNMNISLVEGKVRIDKFLDEKRSQMSGETFLLPGDNLVYNKVSSVTKKGHFDLKKTVSWKDNIIYFEKTRFEDAIQTLEQWYDVEFTILNRGNDEILVNGEFKNQSLDIVLKSMSYSKFSYQINKDKIILKFL